MATQTDTVKKVEDEAKEKKQIEEGVKEKKKVKPDEPKPGKKPARTPPSPLVTIVEEVESDEPDLSSPEYFLNRELMHTWHGTDLFPHSITVNYEERIYKVIW